MVESVILVGVGVLFLILGLVFLTGRGSFLLAGYNTMSKEKKAKYNAEALCKFMGKILLPIGILIFGFLIDGIQSWFPTVFFVLTIALVIFAVIYANTGQRFKK